MMFIYRFVFLIPVVGPISAVVSGCTAILSLVVLLVRGFGSADGSSVELGAVVGVTEGFKLPTKSTENSKFDERVLFMLRSEPIFHTDI